ncbi:MAG: GDP-fucose synthetase [Candidatus Staskawiczbacteria bacterium RIFOXYB2_FULL_32_9]|uniref:GDP-L-fucose synthase n=1 Tax=Candidatus Staskawiczbacteria bacterium RIFOXYD1_FULL_32_13 TaxID=1802234 RepID=A0A1G2JQ81_9BACT|nr:MAG: GDP-L-fucose synthase [Parcubacteria group bacterium GW2011_GWC2_32_10]OGZ79846.1 MAG: GDP-fucose synthetase [Candidatus Staskawiczbacteria bacterium RIFOXYB1_FULL_32_11]OGZ81223.1 MAG: GDP-fucose synthetase [Candidatus Staskawiczbacteria bacterium RIFOXYB2_FULL_32_9]OGZ88385.1 MAG: GDP-fucose synthetase [Candidatus Staskawiczbacteria bacterium RIFOXYC2_FULL_32_10]OGZ89289.1 MAG: GDP-fucose synthetase [Candidatus Staskawiczbacteria bacterium RIFOXYD1_FULL_32_13]
MIDLTKKKILVTGAYGFVGKHLVENLLNIRRIPKENLYLPTKEEINLIKWQDCKKVVEGQDIIIHLAAKVGGIGLNMEKPGELFYDNLMMGTQLMEAARQIGVEKFTGIVTVCAYPKFTPVPFKEEYIWSGYPEETNAPYGLAKKMLMVQSQAYRDQYGFNAISLFPVNMYGPGDAFEDDKSHVIAALIKKIYNAKKWNKEYIDVWGTGEVSREFLYVKDGVEGIILATENYDKSEPVNIGSGKEITIKELVNLVASLMDFKGEIRWDKTKPNGQPRRCLDISRAKNEFGFMAKTDFIEGLKNTIKWYQENNE